MKYFFRSVKYALRYKLRLAASLTCVLMIALLWGAGLGVLLPAMKVLISEEGLHGWADNTLVNDRLGMSTVRYPLAGLEQAEQFGEITHVISVSKLAKDSPLAGRVAVNDWLIGLGAERYGHDELYRKLAEAPEDQDVAIMVYDRLSGETPPVEVAFGEPRMDSYWIHRAVGMLPRPVGENRFGLLCAIIGVAFTLTVARNLVRLFQTYLTQTTVYRAIMDIRCENYAVAVRLPLSYYAVNGVSDTMSRFVADCNQIGVGLVALLGKTLVEPAKLIGAFSIALYWNPKLTLLACVVGPPTMMLIRRLGKMIRKASRRALENQAKLLQSLEETLNGVRIVKAYTHEQAEQKRFRGITRQMYTQLKRVSRADAATGPLVESLGFTAAMAAVILAGYWMYHPVQHHSGLAGWLLDNNMDQTEFMAVMGALVAMFDPLRRLSQVSVRFYNADAAARRVFELRDEPIETDLKNAEPLERLSESIEFRDLSFTYPAAQRPALSHINLKMWQGESVAVVGGNGSGKTTLLSMLLRFYDPASGQVLIDGTDIAKVQLSSLRNQIGLVPQDAVIFNASVAENIAYGASEATREQIIAAAKQAFANEFITQIPGGYDAVIGEHGSTLSGGQRQRIAIARAILRDPAILILDEAMSQIDSESEAKIHDALQSVMTGRTTLVIAHRFSTVVNADSVVVMHDGRIVDTGSHDELVGRCGVYRTLFETQLIGDG